MKQCLRSTDWDIPSEKAVAKIHEYMKQKDWYAIMADTGEIIPFMQLTFGQLLEMCQDNDIDYDIKPLTKDPVNYLWKKIVDHYEQATNN